MDRITKLPAGHIFVFGSNLAGRHGAGAAADAFRHFGAVYGQGIGLAGQSYALPTKDEAIRTLPLKAVAHYARLFMDYAEMHPELTFHLTAVGCGLAGFKNEEIQPLFKDAPNNVIQPPEWDYLNQQPPEPPKPPLARHIRD